MKKLQKKENAITLIALVITIIILLILAGISIAQLTGNGLFEKAKLAKEESKNAQEDEDRKITEYSNEINNYMIGNRNTYSKYDYLYELEKDSSYMIPKNINSDVSKYARTLNSNVNDYDIVVIYFNHINAGSICGNCIVDKKLYNKANTCMLAYSSDVNYNQVTIKVNSNDNRIQFENHSHSGGQQVTIYQVIGIKF